MYEYRTITTTTGTVAAPKLILPGNAQRVCIILSQIGGTTCYLSSVGQDPVASAFLFASGLGTFVMPYRDYGPLVQGELWISSTGLAFSIRCTEITKLPC